MIRGGCHCGAVRYEVHGDIIRFHHCHCRTCRKIHGTAFGSSAVVAAAEFRIVNGREFLRPYESSPGKQRCFCTRCGSHVFARYDDKDICVLRIGTVDGDPGARPQSHIWISEMADWYTLGGDLPRFERFEFDEDEK